MALCKLVKRNYGGKSPVSIKYQNLYSLKEGVILLCQIILETRRTSHLHGSALFTIPVSIKYQNQHKNIENQQHKNIENSWIIEQNLVAFVLLPIYSDLRFPSPSSAAEFFQFLDTLLHKF